MTTTPHSRIGASTCERWWNCPGSVRAVAALPPQPESPYASEGTAAHELGEICLRDGSEASTHVGEFAKNGIEFTEEMANAVQMYLDVIRFDLETYGMTKEDLRIEHRFHLTNIDKDAFGTCDCVLPIAFEKVIVYDYKHGQGVAVDVEDNKQTMYYSLGAIELGDFPELDMVIVQPRAVHRDGPIRRSTVSIETLTYFGEAVKERIEATRAPKAELSCGVWCRKTFCPAMATCPAVKGRVQRDAMVIFNEKPVVALPKPEEISPLALRRLLDGLPLIEAWLKAVWAHAEQKANNGEFIEGYKLVRGREGNRKWIDEQRVRMLFGDRILKSQTMSVAEFEKVATKEEKQDLPNFITRSEGKITLVPEDDPREEVSPAATTAFVEIDIFS